MPTYDLLGKHFPISGGTTFSLIRSIQSPFALAKGNTCKPRSYQFVGWDYTSGTSTGSSAVPSVYAPVITREWDETARNFTLDFDPCSDTETVAELGTTYRRYHVPYWQYFPNYPDLAVYTEGSLEQITYINFTAKIVKIAESERYSIDAGGKGSYLYPMIFAELSSWTETGSKPYASFPEFKPPLTAKYYPKGCGPDLAVAGPRGDGLYDYAEYGSWVTFNFTSPCTEWEFLTSQGKLAWVINY